MPPSTTDRLFHRIARVRSDLKQLESDLLANGERDLSKAVKRAYRELDHPAVTGAENTRGVAHRGVRQ